MALIQASPSQMRVLRGTTGNPISNSINGRTLRVRRGRPSLDRSRRPGPARPGGAPLCYRNSGVGMSAARYRRHGATVGTTVGLALLAGGITLCLGLVAQLGSTIHGGSGGSPIQGPDRLAVVRVEPGESLEDVAARVAPGTPPRQVIDRIRELNALDSTRPAAGRTLIAPFG